MLSNFLTVQSTTSTNDLVRGYPVGTILKSLTQTNGRGRSGKHWLSPDGGIYFSFSLSIDKFHEYSGLESILLGVALHNALSQLTDSKLFLKWPNDLLDEEGKKLAGILIEKSDANTLIIGIGINLQSPDDFNQFAYFKPKQKIEQVFILQLFFAVLDDFLSSKYDLISLWQNSSSLLPDDPLVLHFADQTSVQGYFVGINRDGSIKIKTENDEFKNFNTGVIYSLRKAK